MAHEDEKRAAEDAAIADIPAGLWARLLEARSAHKANGGCKGCWSLVLAVHAASCPEGADDFY